MVQRRNKRSICSRIGTIRSVVESVVTLVESAGGCDDGIELRLQYIFVINVEKFGVTVDALLRACRTTRWPRNMVQGVTVLFILEEHFAFLLQCWYAAFDCSGIAVWRD